MNEFKFIDYVYDKETKQWFLWQGWLDYIDLANVPRWLWRLSFAIDDYVRWIQTPRKRTTNYDNDYSSELYSGSKYILRRSGLGESVEGCSDSLEWFEDYNEFNSIFDLHLYLRTSVRSNETGLPIKEHSVYDICKKYDFEIYQKVNLDEHPDIRRRNNPHPQG